MSQGFVWAYCVFSFTIEAVCSRTAFELETIDDGVLDLLNALRVVAELGSSEGCL